MALCTLCQFHRKRTKWVCCHESKEYVWFYNYIIYSILTLLPLGKKDSSLLFSCEVIFVNENMLTLSWFSLKSTSLDLDCYHIDTDL